MAIGDERNGRSQIRGGLEGDSRKLTSIDALQFLKQVKDVSNRGEKYERFIQLMKDFKSGSIDTEGVVATIKELFKGHNNLILGFNLFLPEGYKITLEEDITPASKETVKVEESTSFMNKTQKQENVECSICLGKLRVGFIQLECSHRFHAKCFNTWWTINNPTCPYCRFRVNRYGEKDP